MMNRPRPRKIINVIKTSPSAEIEEKTTKNSDLNNFEQFTNEKQSAVPLNSMNTTRSIKNESSTSNVIPPPNSINFLPRKPVVATLKKSHVPPPPTFSDSPKTSPITLTKNESEFSLKRSPIEPVKVAESLNNGHKELVITSIREPELFKSPPVDNNSNRSSLSPKSSGEAFLDAADKAADFISGTLLNSFKGFNLSDTSSVKISSPIPTSSKETQNQLDDDNPFADIMKKLKSTSSSNTNTNLTSSSSVMNKSPNLMDEEPPESFNLSSEPFANEIVIDSKEPVFTESDYTKENENYLEFKESENNFEQFNESYATNSNNVPNVIDNLVDNVAEDNFKYEPEAAVQGNIESASQLSIDLLNNDSSTIASDKVISDCPNPYSKAEPVNVYEFKTSPATKSEDFEVSPASSGIKFSPPSIVYTSSSTVNIVNTSTPPNSTVNSTSTVPFFDSLGSVNSSDQSIPLSLSPTSSAKGTSTGFRASILKHGLSALEKIGKSTADVVVSTRNKLSEPTFVENNSSNVITPDFTDESSSFQDVLRLYGGHSKLQELQIKGIKSSIAMKLERKSVKIDKLSSFEYQSRLKLRRQIAEVLHPDRIMDSIDDGEINNSIFFADTKFPVLFKCSEDEIFCIQRLLKSLDNILIIKSPNMDESIIISSNRRRHIICQISTVYSTMLSQSSEPLTKASEISSFASQIIKYLQTNFSRNCEEYPRADRDQQLAIKLILDLSYSIVPQLQQQL